MRKKLDLLKVAEARLKKEKKGQPFEDLKSSTF
jgi:hypothetical protein